MKIKELVADYGEKEVSQEILDKLGIKVSKVWKPKKGEEYWYVDWGCLYKGTWGDDLRHGFYYNTCNCFKTQEEAEFHKQELLVEGELKLFAEEHNECELDWERDSQGKYFIYYNYFTKRIDVDGRDWCKTYDIFFTSEEIAKQAINEIGEDRLKKYYFGVKEGKLK